MDNDLISRSALLTSFLSCPRNCENCNSFNEDTGNCSLIENAPTVEQPQGEWHRIDYPLKAKRNVIIYTCNLCGEISDSNKYNFCPYCGAKMANSAK